MKIYKLFIAFLFPAFVNAQVSADKPKLIVGIMVDQMRNDYLFRFEDGYGEGGFKRLMKDGYYCANHHFSYTPTSTGPGHASVYTGTTPSVHGIVGNNWYDPLTKEGMYCVQDKSVRTVGIANADGQMSPRNLQTTTITDELRLFWNMRSKVVGVALKDRGAILPAGKLGTAYWFSKSDFISSSYYMENLPAWVVKFNKENRVQKYIDAGWKPNLSLDAYTASLPDDNPYEKILAGEGKPVMPKNFKALAEENGAAELVKLSPYGNTITFDFAKAALVNEELGKDEITDFLAVSFSSPDYIGHAYGPRAVEVQDMYLKFDQELEDFLKFLDREVGKGAYLVFLTADHGAAEVATFSMDINLPGGMLNTKSLLAQFQILMEEIHPEGLNLIENLGDERLYFDRERVKAAGLNVDDLAQTVADKIARLEGVYAAYPSRDVIMGGAQNFPLLQLQRGLHPTFAGDVVWVLKSGYLDYGKTGTTHGSPWRYDTHSPMFFFGKGVTPGITYRETNIRDIAPTISMMLNLPLPSGSTGNPIESLLLNK